MSWTFDSHGTPRTKGSTRSFRAPHGAIVTKGANPLTSAWQGVIAHAAAQAGVTPLPVVDLGVVFYFTRPKSHYGTGRNAGRLKAGAPPSPISHQLGDVDKLLRAVLDALTGVAYLDDAHVVEVRARKCWAHAGEPERAEITVQEWSCPACSGTGEVVSLGALHAANETPTPCPTCGGRRMPND